MESITSTASAVYNKSKKTLTNEYVLATLAVLAVTYVGGLAPKLPTNVMHAMDNIVVKGVMFFLIALAVSRNVIVSIIVALVVLAVILAVQVYLKDDTTNSPVTEHLQVNNRLQNGPINNVNPYSNPAPVMIDNNDELQETQPLGKDWATQDTTFPEGWNNDWDEYEQPAQYNMNVSESASHNDGSCVSNNYVSAAMNGVLLAQSSQSSGTEHFTEHLESNSPVIKKGVYPRINTI
jgi:hypothetical protein